jgi:hypothetical protein
LLVDPKNGSISSEYFSALQNDKYLQVLIDDILVDFNNGIQHTMNTPHYSGPYRMQDSLGKYTGKEIKLIAIKDVFEYDYWEIRQMEDRITTKPMIHYWLHTWMK